VKEETTAEEEVQDAVFAQTYIPRTLQELTPEEIDKHQKSRDKILYAKLTGLQAEAS
jgi:hypothetical protein